MSNSGRVSLGLYGDFPPDEVAQYAGIPFMQSVSKGSRDPRRPIPPYSILHCSTEKVTGEYIDIYELAEQLVTNLRPFQKIILEAKQRWGFETVIQCVIEVSADETVSTPVVGFSKEVVSFAAAIDAEIDVDIYRS